MQLSEQITSTSAKEPREQYNKTRNNAAKQMYEELENVFDRLLKEVMSLSGRRDAHLTRARSGAQRNYKSKLVFTNGRV